MFVSSAEAEIRVEMRAPSAAELLMPIFEYRCEGCGHKFEAILFGSQTPECPQCYTEKLEKQLSTFAVSTGSSALPAAGCGETNCCMMKGGCEN